MNCRGPERRKEIVRDYQIECSAHIRLLDGRTIRSDAGKDIKRAYYIFECKDKKNLNIVREIYCGESAGKDFLRLANITAPPIFNMLQEPHEVGRGGEQHIVGDIDQNHEEKWNEAAQQLYDAIMILITAWDMKPGRIFEYLRQAKIYYYCPPYAQRIEKINNILHRNNTSLRDVLNALAVDNHLREYHFNLLEDILHQNNIISYFEDRNGR